MLALAVAGVPDALMHQWVPRLEQSGPRGSTDTVLARVLREANGSEKILDELAAADNATGTAAPKIWVIWRGRDELQAEAAMAISLLVWPRPAALLPWDEKAWPPAALTDPRGARILFLGDLPRGEQPGPGEAGWKALGPQLWFRPGSSLPGRRTP